MSLQNCTTSFFNGNTSTFKAIPFIRWKTCGLFENWRLMTFRWCSIFWYFSLAQDAFNFCSCISSLYSKVRSFVFPNCFSNISSKRFLVFKKGVCFFARYNGCKFFYKLSFIFSEGLNIFYPLWRFFLFVLRWSCGFQLSTVMFDCICSGINRHVPNPIVYLF